MSIIYFLLYCVLQYQAGLPGSVLESGVDCSKGYYLLDPDNNLPRTQQRLTQAFMETKWQGLCAKPPTHDQFKHAISKNDVFV